MIDDDTIAALGRRIEALELLVKTLNDLVDDERERITQLESDRNELFLAMERARIPRWPNGKPDA